MKIPEEILKILKNIEVSINDFFSNVTIQGRRSKEADKFTSDEWLFEQISKGFIHGKPAAANTFDIKDIDADFFKLNTDLNFLKPLINDTDLLCSSVAGRHNAICSFYPKNGFMSWHTNWDAPGLGILFSWSSKGDGYFKSYNDKTKNFEMYQDEVGWNVKGVYMKNKLEGLASGNSWHCVSTNSERFSIGFILSDEGKDVDFCYETLEEFELKETPNGIWI